MIGRLLREPLAHFLFAGAVLWALFAWRGEPVDPADRTIALTRAELAELSTRFEAQTRRPPTGAELDSLVEQRLREEVLYREALRLGLDRDDPVVRRRMAQKMDQLAANAAVLEEPSEAALRDWLARHPERFGKPGQVSFEQALFASEAEARAALERGNPGGEASSLPRAWRDAGPEQVAARFGRGFADELVGLPADSAWYGPLRSGVGWHLVRVTDREPPRLPPLDNIRERVEADWRSARERSARERGYRALRDAYKIEVAE